MGVACAAGQRFQRLDNVLKRCALSAEFLCTLRIVPDAGLGKLVFDFCQALLASIKVKDTP